MKVLISINNKTWSTHKFSNAFNRVWVWKRHYKRGYLWTPFVFLSVEKMNKNEISK